MVDYYAILLRAVTTTEAGDAQWRRGVYQRARRMLAEQMRDRRPSASQAEIAAEQDALDAAIKRIETEMAWTERTSGSSSGSRVEPNQWPIAEWVQLRGRLWMAFAVIVAALCAGGYVYWSSHRSTNEAANVPPNILSTTNMAAKDGDIPPGIDGGAMDAEQSYVFRRQPTFYRTLEPVGTVIIDKLQHFLYLIRLNNVALRYGIGVGGQCVDLAGLRRISSMAEWPPWEAPLEMVKQRLAKPGILAGGPGNPLGARVLELDDNTSRINGTNAPKTIGTTVVFGCIRLGNDDIMDLYRRVVIGTRIVVN
jgi:lipoprotein-anchoring transpeptidase ErfK/SrfK